MEENYSDVIDFANAIITRTTRIVFAFDRSNVNKVIVLYHLARATSVLKSIVFLCESGYSAEAKILMRSLLNLYINISWILKEDTENRLVRYFEMDKVYKHKAACHTYPNKCYPEAEKTPKIIECEKEVNDILSKYKVKDINKVTNWANTSISEMAKETGLFWEYNVMYLILSDADHTGPISIMDYFNNHDNFILSPKSINFLSILLFSIEYLLGTEMSVLKYFHRKYKNVTYDLLHLEALCSKYQFEGL